MGVKPKMRVCKLGRGFKAKKHKTDGRKRKRAGCTVVQADET
jgi:hypothetical protein